MINPVSLKTKKDKWGNPIFPFIDVFPVYERTASVSLREKAMLEWKEFLSGKRTQLTHKYLAVLAAIIPEEYSKFLDYVFSHNVLDEEIALILFRQLHPLWTSNPYFEQLLQLGKYVNSYQGSSSKIKHLKAHYSLLFLMDSPQRTGNYFYRSLKEKWSGNPRNLHQIDALDKIFQNIYTEIYQETLPGPDEIKGCTFPVAALAELFKRVEPELALADNYTQDFIMNPKIVKKSVAKSVFSLGIDYIQERKKQLETEYINQLYKRYISQVLANPCSNLYLQNLEEIAGAIYKFYPLDYKKTNNLPDYAFVKSIFEKLIAESWDTLSLCTNFMQDLRLIKFYPKHGKLIDDLVQSHATSWVRGKEGVKSLYLNKMADSYINNFSDNKADSAYLRQLENIENDFRAKYDSGTENELFDEMALRLIQLIMERTWASLKLCDCKAFRSDFRLRRVEVETPILSSIFDKKIIDKTDVLIQYIFAFEKEGFFEQLNNIADDFAKYAFSSYNQIQQRNARAGRILLDYYNLQKILTTFTGNNTVAEERRAFWIDMRRYVTDIFKVFQVADRLLFLASFNEKLVLDSTKYAEAGYIFQDVSAEFLSEHIQFCIGRSASNMSPVSIANSLYGYRSEQVRHSSGWQKYLKGRLISGRFH